MKRIFLISLLLSFAYTPVTFLSKDAVAQSANCYRDFYQSGIHMEVCEYNSGTSGYFTVKNNSGEDANVCWTLTAQNGETTRGCRNGLENGRESSSSCTVCNRGRTGGIVYIDWRKVEFY